jgi:hypothetical protein
MPKLEGLKERISYLRSLLTMLLGLMVLLAGGVINLYLQGQLNVIFWREWSRLLSSSFLWPR